MAGKYAPERHLVSYPIYNLELAGWRRQSTWGWDPGQQSYYAQLTPDTSSREAEWQGPEIWVSPPRYPAIPDPVVLAEAIAQATGVPLAIARQAMNDSLAEGDPLRQPMERRRTEAPSSRGGSGAGGVLGWLSRVLGRLRQR